MKLLFEGNANALLYLLLYIPARGIGFGLHGGRRYCVYLLELWSG